MICRHCHQRDVNCPRGLCWTCYYTPGVREQYPPGSANPATAKFCKNNDYEPSEAELDAMIAEQLPTMPERGPGEE